jgi:hypothetical protein
MLGSYIIHRIVLQPYILPIILLLLDYYFPLIYFLSVCVSFTFKFVEFTGILVISQLVIVGVAVIPAFKCV